jgi:two-component system, chemotaxis family, protein-glutamate methylesterase/glutaminase
MVNNISVLVVDDSAFMRKAVLEILTTDPSIEVVGVAKNGLEALKMVRALNPDVIILDIDMPVMDGLTSLRHMMIESPTPTVILSSLFTDGGITFEALRLGVVDFVPKPSGAISENIDMAKQNLIDRVKIAKSVNMENVRRVRLSKWKNKDRFADLYRFRALDYILAIGTTLSGPNTVIRLLSNLSPKIPASLVVVQEISPKVLASFVHRFDEHVPWKVEVAKHNMVLEQGVCYIGSTEKKMCVQTNYKGEAIIAFSESKSKPLDLLFSSASEVFRQNTIGVLLTGIGNDGAEGMADIRKVSGVTLAQDAQTCVYPNLTDHAVKCGVIDIVLNETKLSKAIETIIT